MNKGSNNRRSRGRGGNKRHGNIRNQTFESNGPGVKVRGSAQQVLDKYLALARDASSSGDRIAAESYFQFAEHYYRLLNTEEQRNGDRNQQPRGRGGNGRDRSDTPGGAEGGPEEVQIAIDAADQPTQPAADQAASQDAADRSVQPPVDPGAGDQPDAQGLPGFITQPAEAPAPSDSDARPAPRAGRGRRKKTAEVTEAPTPEAVSETSSETPAETPATADAATTDAAD